MRRQTSETTRRMDDTSHKSYTTTPCSGSAWRDSAGIGGGTGGASSGTGFTTAARSAGSALCEWRSTECRDCARIDATRPSRMSVVLFIPIGVSPFRWFLESRPGTN